MDKHTPGPWKVFADGAIDVGSGFMPFGGCGCCGSPWINGKTPDERNANARLIAAAPDLLDALRGMLNIGETKAEYDAAMQRAVDAIAKATGDGA